MFSYLFISMIECYLTTLSSVQMSLTVQEIILDAQKLVIRISDHENTADHLISEIEAAYNQINNMKEVRIIQL